VKNDIHYTPLYTRVETARYTRTPITTMQYWCSGGAVIKPENPHSAGGMSFINLIEVHVLAALRRTHRMPLHKIRDSVRWLKNYTRIDHPLAELDIQTDGFNLFIDHLGQLISASENGQTVIREIVEKYLRRIERDSHGRPVRFFPFTRDVTDVAIVPNLIVMDPVVAFGRPVIQGTRVTAATILERWAAGDDINLLARDYDVNSEAIQEAIRCETLRHAA